MLVSRVATGAGLIAIFVGVLWLDEKLAPWYPLWLALSLVLFGVAALEIIGLLNATSAKPSGNTVFGGVLAIAIANWAPHAAAGLLHPPGTAPIVDPTGSIEVLAWPLWTFVVILMFSFIAQSAQFNRPGGTMAAISGTVLATAYVGLLGSFAMQTRWLYEPFHGMLPPAMLIATAKGADTGAYTLGRIAGRHKLWPRLSPKKTIEGALGGMVFGVAASLFIVAFARLRAGRQNALVGVRARVRHRGGLRRPARGPDGIHDQARLRAQGRLGRPPRIRRSPRRARFDPFRRAGGLRVLVAFWAIVRGLTVGKISLTNPLTPGRRDRTDA